MTSKLFKKNINNNEKFSQKCCIFANSLSNSRIKIGDFVEINCGLRNCICRVFINSDFINSVVIDDTVSWFKDSKASNHEFDKIVYDIQQDFTVVKVFAALKVEIKIEFRKDVENFNLSAKQYCNIASQLVQNYAVKNNVIIRCSGKELADFFNISNIIVCNLFVKECSQTVEAIYGRISRTTSVELIGIISEEESNLLKILHNIEIGGISDAMEQLRKCIKVCKRILVLGPSGCGKSTLLKKFCCHMSCYFLILDGYSCLTLDKCKSICNQLINSAKMFREHSAILVIDNIDQLTSLESKKADSADFLEYLIQSLESYNIVIIAATTHKGLLNTNISLLFETEVSLGVPSFKQRKEQLEVLLKDLNNKNIDLNYIAQKTPGFVVGDIKLLAEEIFSIQGSKNVQGENCRNVTMEDVDKVLLSITPSLLKTSEWSLKVKPIYWSDIGGMNHIKERLQMCIEKPLLYPEIFEKVDLPCPRGVLLFGPPGCCKTTIARGLATECKANFFAANPSQIYSPYVGVAEKNISKLFYEARLCSPSIIFLDELDSLVGRRELDSKMVGVAEKVLSTLLTEMDGFGVSTAYGGSENPQKILSYGNENDKNDINERMTEQVIVVAATNRPDRIDDALMRPGRFDVIVYVPPPNVEERESILKTYTDGAPLQNVNLRNIAEKAEHFSGADLKHLHTMAVLNGLRNNENLEYITEEHYMQALQSVRPSINPQQIEMYEQLASRYGTFISK